MFCQLSPAGGTTSPLKVEVRKLLINAEMNPYVQNVVNSTAQLGNQQFSQQTLPQLESAVGANGQFGSARGDATIQQAANQNAFNINNTQAGLMNTGYNQAQQNYQNEQAIGLQGAQTLGALGTQANNMATQNAMLGANQAATYSGALSAYKTPTVTSSSGSSAVPTYFAPVA